MNQTRKGSLMEAITNVAIGMGISLAASMVLYPLHGAHFTFATNFYLTCEFTVLSIIRSYLVRRWHNRKLMKEHEEDEHAKMHKM